MEALFVLTHTIMLICLISIIGVSIPNLFDDDQIEKRSFIASQMIKLKSKQINTVYISRIVTALLTLFLR